ncbi:sn-glycerol-3-phosphate ABC transporter ATP-binding protein UgpC [Acrocarpospora sp. B8E8]|uniref:ABC transporter ATP-binding protein n=1 Tax=Acrocarpospora sp. B8E8 TaxID=3153572 RepID=UPI00325EC98C
MAEIVFDGVSKRFPDGTTAVHDINLTIADREFVILVGPSGCGKSTTLNMIAGLEEITSGELRIDGERVNERAPRDRDIAMVFQSYALYPHMTVRENMAFPLTLAKMPKPEIAAKVHHAADLLDLTPLLDRKPANLSGGQRQRVAMGRAIVRDPKAFLMDEPLSNLDAKLRVQMRTSISRLQKRLGTTTVYVTHDQTEAMTLGDRIVIMQSGVVQQVGTPQDLYDHPANQFVAGFIGSPSMNFLPAEVHPDGLHTIIGTIPYGSGPRRLPREVIVGIRPELFQDTRIRHGAWFTGTVDIIESMGAEKLAYFTFESGATTFTAATQVVARLDPKSPVREGELATIWYDPAALHIFDPTSGTNLT